MEKISEMIERLCPEGVEKVPLWKITAWDKKFNAVDNSMQKKIIKYNYFLAKELDELVDNSGDVRILYTTEDIAFTTEEKAIGKVSEGEVVTIPWGGNPTVKYYKGRFITGDNRIATSLDKSRLDNKYLYYWMLGQLDVISTYYRGAGIKHPSMFMVLTMEIPLPPLSIQQEIVRVLDSFTAMITNLETELASRQKQYEHYRNQLITSEEGVSLKVSEFCELKAGKAIKASELSEIKDMFHPYPCFGGNGIRGYIAKTSHEGDYSIIGRQGALCGCINWATGEFYATEHAVVATPKSNCDTKFLFYLFTFADLNKYKSQGAQPGLAVSNLNELCYKIPSLQRQKEIVEILDTFETLITNIKQELEARKKQYEYYREKLLTFE